MKLYSTASQLGKRFILNIPLCPIPHIPLTHSTCVKPHVISQSYRALYNYHCVPYNHSLCRNSALTYFLMISSSWKIMLACSRTFWMETSSRLMDNVRALRNTSSGYACKEEFVQCEYGMVFSLHLRKGFQRRPR